MEHHEKVEETQYDKYEVNHCFYKTEINFLKISLCIQKNSILEFLKVHVRSKIRQ